MPMQPDQSEELFVVELDERLEFGVSAVDEIGPVEVGNDSCENTSWCTGANGLCHNGSNCG